MSVQEFEPIVTTKDGRIRCENIPGLSIPISDVSAFLDRVIAHAGMVGQIVERFDPNDRKGRKIDLPKLGSSAHFLTRVYCETKDLDAQEEKRQKALEMLRVF